MFKKQFKQISVKLIGRDQYKIVSYINLTGYGIGELLKLETIEHMMRNRIEVHVS